MNLFLDFCASESGQDLTEYGLLAALVSLASILALTSFGTTLSNYWNSQVEILKSHLG
jgi:Flp pilus assembly pilin Flp